MAYQQNRIDQNHQNKRNFLRKAGTTLLIAGILLLVIGMADFFTSLGPPKFFWLNFVAMPLIFVGATMSSMGFMGAAARYSAQEMAPVAKDTFNYMADGTREGVETITRAVKEGLSKDNDGGVLSCSRCGKDNPAGSAFCNGCGHALETRKTCSKCGYENPSDASFCNGCGGRL